MTPSKFLFIFSSAKPLASFILACLFGVTLLATEARGARGRPQVDQSLGFNVILSDKQTLLRGVSISFDGGDPYGSLPAVMPTQLQLDALAKTYGLNTLHLYLEGDSAGPNGNNDPVGYNAAACDLLVQRCADAGLYLIITIGCNGKNGQMNLEWSQRFWNFYGPRYKNQTHVIYEAHNEPAPNSLWQWTTNDWNNQIALYKAIRAVAPDTLILLCSFMGFAGDNNLNSVYDPRNRANYLVANGVDWSNAAIAHHGYESKIGVETAISLLQSGTSYPALLCTEFWPGDTTGQEYNNMYESHHNGWMQFQWLGADDNDLSGSDGFKQKINTAGTVWTPDAPTCNWPARGTPVNIPAHNSTVGIYARGDARFVRVNAAGDLVADLVGYTGSQGDRFTVERSGMNLISLKASNGLYVSSSSQTDSLSAVSPTAGAREKFQWIELASGAVVLRAYGGGGHLLRPANGVILPDADNGLATSTHYTLVNGSAPSGPPPLPTNLPSPWQTADIGAVGAPGTVNYGSGVFSVAGSGADIEGTADAFRFVYLAANGDVTIVARVATQQNTDYWAKTGVMIRESATAGSANAAVLVSAEGGVVFQRRSSANGSTAVSRVEGFRAPRWVKLVRTGNSFSAYHSADGAVWTQIETSQTINMAASATVGLAVCSHKVDTLGESTLDNVAVSGASAGVAAPAFSPAPGSYASAQSVAISSATPGASIRYTLDGTTPSSTTGTPYSGPVNIAASTTLKALAYASGATDSAVTTGVYTLGLLPSPWQAADIGAVGPSGTTFYGSGVFTVAGSGADIEGTADAFRYVYQAANGDVTIVARVATLQNTDYWAKTGVMIRESAAAGSAHAAVLVSAEGGVVFQRRSSANGSTAVTRVEGLRAPRWVKLIRTGNSFSAYHSADGVVWTQIETSQTVNMAASATVGLAVCSHKVNTLGESTLDNVAVSGGSGGATPLASYTTQINPSENRGTWEGWGCSLAWWANVFGTRDDLADILFTTKDSAVTTNTASSNGQILPGLGMNIARYNAGGCTDNEIEGRRMVASPNIPAFKQIEGFWRDWYNTDPTSASWRWSADATQRAMLLKARDRGANLFELFSNSPLWWMCENYNPSGSSSGTTDNLQSWNHEEHAIYLANVAKYAKDNWGITFNSVAPFNEPIAGWWREDGTQEGCYFSTNSQASVIGHLRTALNNRGLQSALVAASDESKYDMALDTWNSFNATTRAQIGQVNVHGYQYGGGRRDLLRSAVGNKRLWNSEYGEADSTGMELASNLNLDFEYLLPTAWCYWQPLDSGGWGLIRSNPGDNWIGEVNPKYFVLAQYSRHIRPGMTIINGGSRNTIAAYDQLGKKLVIVTTNYGTAQSITHDLSAFSFLGGPIRCWTTQTGAGDKYALRTDLSLSGKSLTAFFPANTVQTFEIPVAYQTGTPLAFSPTTYEAESGTLNGSAGLENGGQYVGNLGNGLDNWVEIRNVNVPIAGSYRITVSYASGDDSRALTLRMNGNDSTRITQNVPNTGGWNTTGTITYDVALQSGINIIRFYNANTSGNTYAPPVDRISVPPSPLPTISVSGALSAVNTTFPNASSPPASFNVSGTAMTSGILVSPPVGFEVSTASGGPYAQSVTIGTAGTITSTQIFLRLAANTTPGTYTGNVVLSSFGATSVNVATASNTVSAISTITAGSGTLTARSATFPNASTAATFTVSGATMTAGISVAAPTGFEVSADGVTYAPSITFGAAGTIANTTVSVRLAANTPPGSYNGNITLNSPGAAQQTRAIASSTVTGTATITAGSSTLSARSATFPNASTAATFTVSGATMRAGITVVAPTGFEVSVPGVAYASSITFGAAGTIANTTVSVRLAANTPPGSYSGNVTLNSPGALRRTRAIASSTVTATATITVSGTFSAFSTTSPDVSSVQTFTVSGATMSAGITAAAPTGFELSVAGGSYAPSITFGAAGTIATTIVSVRLAANTPSGTYNGNITLNSSGALQRTLSIPTGTVSSNSSYSIGGTVTSSGNSLPDVTLAITGTAAGSVVSDSAGNYIFTGLPNGNYTVTPSKPGYLFNPPSKTLSISDANQTAHNFSYSFDPAAVVTIPFGSGQSIVYNKSSKSYNVFYGTTRIITHALAKVKNGNTDINSSDYATASMTNAPHSDGLGSGTKFTVTLEGSGLPQMKQVFYVYATKGYFLTEISIHGASLSSNYMAPLAANSADLQVAGDHRSLFVPFDNDTFVRYDSKPISESVTSSEVGAIYESSSRTGLVAGSVQSDTWKTGVKAVGAGRMLSELTVWGGYTELGVTRDRRAHGSLVGSTIKSPRIFVGYFADFRDGMDEYGKAVNVFNPRYIFDFTGSAPFAYNTWGDIQSDLTLGKAKAVVDFVQTQLPEFRSDNKVYIDLDSFWDNLSSNGLTGDFSQLTEFANYCKARGLQPGIYWAPFVDWGKTQRNVEGSASFTYNDIWTRVNGGFHELNGTRALDPTHPGTKERINFVIDKFKACGFEFIKLDFIGHAAVEADSWHDPSVKTGYQAFNQGMKHLTDRLANQMLVYAAISPNVATGPYAHVRRVACDAFAQIGDTEYTMNSVSYGWWQTHIYNFIDADHIVFGSRYEASATEGENRARFASALTCGPIVLGDDFSSPDIYSDRIKGYAQRQVLLDISRKGGKAFRPVETNSGSAAVDTYSSQIGNDLYVVVFNYSAGSKSYNIGLDRLGLSGSYTAKELFSLSDISVNGALTTTVAAKDAKIFKIPTTASIIAAPTSSVISFGQTLASSVLSGGSGSVSGTFSFTHPDTIPKIGTSTHSVTFTPSIASNLRGTTTLVTVTVNKALVEITQAPTASTITFGQTLASSALTGGTASAPGTFAFTTPATAPNAGTASQGITFTPTDTTNYNTATTTISVTVNKATPTISAAPIASAIIFGQTLASSTLTGGTASTPGSFAFTTPATAPNAGTASQGVTFTPTDAANYNTTTTTVSVTVNKATPTITAAPTASAITYGQTLADSTLTGGIASTAGSFAFTAPATAPNAGTASQGVTFTPTDAVNYNTATGTVNVTVAPRNLTITGLKGTNKVYDRSTTASASGTAALDGVVGADIVSLSGTPVFAFVSSNVGTGSANTTTGYTLSGTNAANYSLTQPSLSANITAKELTITGLTGDNKAYDGSTDAAASGTASLSGVVGSDQVSLSGTPVFAFVSADVGTGISITTSGYKLSGLNAGNYTLTQPSLSADITAHELTVTGLTGENKVYDGNVDASASGVAVLNGVIGADDVILSGTPVCIFASANVGVGIAITATGYSLTGADAANYSLIQPSMSANITAHELTITGLTGNDKPHDGNTHATASGTAVLNGVNGADEVILSGTPVFTFATADKGTDIAITTTGYTLTGAAAGNYLLTLPSLRASIFEDPLFANPQNAPRVAVLPGGGVRLTFQGIPGRTYAIERSTTMHAGSWTQIHTVTAGENAQITFDDPEAPAHSAFYRVAIPAQ